MPSQMKLTSINLDCPDALALAAFHQQATGFGLHPESNADFAAVTREDGLVIGFQRVAGYRPPQWPGQPAPQQSTSTSPLTACPRPRPGCWNCHRLTLWPPHSTGWGP
ncbi:VOC family protein [Streptomyces sp. NPDC088554]|uniref:VOC family protein n=1 Tax=Streptomyces sp. NPDC088554 TaxID=3365865 RepID=UPI0037F67CC3